MDPLGGSYYVEALKDVTFRVAPIDRREAYDMLDEIRSGQYAAGWIKENETGRQWFEGRRKEERAHQVERVGRGQVTEVVLALNAPVGGQTTAHYLADRLAASGVTLSRLAHGVPVGGELDHLDDGTLTAALRARRTL